MSTGPTPRVSVVLAVRDGAPWVGDAVRSILGQTLTELELVVVDDGSTDDTPQTLARFADARLRVARRTQLGLTRSLNEGVSLARAPLIARLDADDVAAPERLARQLAFLDAHPEIGLLGTGAIEIDATGREVGRVVPPAADADIRRALIRRNVFVHSSVVMRRQALASARRLRRHVPGRPGLRPLAAARARHPAGQPSGAAGDAAAAGRPRLGHPRGRPPARRGPGAVARAPRRPLPAVVRAVRAPSAAGARAARGARQAWRRLRARA